MNTVGRGNEGWFVIVSLILVTGVGVLITGGVTEFLSVIDDTLMGMVRAVGTWLRSVL
jgi:hypothetical protein